MTLGLVPNEPRAQERAYIKDLTEVFRRAQSLVAHGMNELLAVWDDTPAATLPTPYPLPRGVPRPPRPASATDATVKAQVRWMRRALKALVNRKTLAPLLRKHALAFDRWVTRDVKRVLKSDANAFGLPDRSLLLSWAQENVALIESGINGPSDGVRLKALADDVADVLVEAFTLGVRRGRLAQLLVERFEVSDSRAKLIARDQSTKLTGQLAEQKQTEAGVEEYVWVTEGDDKVRPEHAALNGTTQRWDDPPPPGHPGTDVLCRCRARPVLPDF